MTRILSIALVALRAAVRQRLVVSLAAVLLATILGLGFSIKGDGTVAGQVRILLSYTLGLSAILLGTATLWSACGSISEEIQDKQIQLLAVKPVHRFQIWLGKWVALVLLNAAFLFLAGAATYAILQIKIRSSAVTAEDRRLLREEILIARRSVSPRREPLDNEVRARVAALVKQFNISPRVSRRDLSASVEKQVLAERAVVPPGGSKEWTLDVPANLGRTAEGREPACSLRVRLYPVNRTMTPGKGTWTIGWKENPAAFSHAMTGRWDREYRFAVPLSAFQPGQPAIIRFANETSEATGTVVLDPEQNIELLVRESSFEMNLVRSLLILLGQLALVAALGLAAGTVFSFPVATFVAVAVLILSLVARYLAATAGVPADEHAQPAVPSLYTVVAEHVMKGVDAAIGPAVRLDPLGPLSDGILISWGSTGNALLILLFLYPAALFGVGSYCLTKRELALPE